jgi:hypothetical protein
MFFSYLSAKKNNATQHLPTPNSSRNGGTKTNQLGSYADSYGNI